MKQARNHNNSERRPDVGSLDDVLGDGFCLNISALAGGEIWE